MKRKSSFVFTFTGIVVLFLLACNATFSVGYPTPTFALPTQTPTTEPIPLSQQVVLITQPYIESNQEPVFSITAQIPQLSGSNDPRVLAFNQRLDDLVQKEVTVFRQEFTNAPVMDVTTNSFLEITYALVSQYNDVWSFKFVFFFYTNGAAHPGSYSMTFNYDLGAGKELALNNLFLPDSNYLQRISSFCSAELSKQPFFDGSFMSGADPTLENYRNWNIAPQGLVITFDEYQVAPYAAGAQTVLVPYSELSQVIDPKGLLGRFIQ